MARKGRRNEDVEGYCDVCWVPEWGGGDGVLAHAHGWEEGEEVGEGKRMGGVLFEDVEEGDAFFEDLFNVGFGVLKGFKGGFVFWCGELKEGFDVSPGCGLGKLDVSAEKGVDWHRSVRGLSQSPMLVTDVVSGRNKPHSPDTSLWSSSRELRHQQEA